MRWRKSCPHRESHSLHVTARLAGMEADVRFRDRRDAGRKLAAILEDLRHRDVVVCGMARGGVPVAFEIAWALDAQLDVLCVRKLGAPQQPELAMGAIGEGGVGVVDDRVVRALGVTPAEFERVQQRESAKLRAATQQLRSGRPPADLAGRTVVVVDDGIATGSSARVACQVARGKNAAHVVLAVPVAPSDWTRRLAGVADEYRCLLIPPRMVAVGNNYANFRATRDDEVIDLLTRAAERETRGAD